MSHIAMDHDHKFGMDHGGTVTSTAYGDPGAQWIEAPVYHTPSQQSPVHEYPAFTFQPMPMEPTFHGMPPPRTPHKPLQPLIMPQWPSMLASPGYAQSVFPPAMLPMGPPMGTPLSATSTSSSGFGRPAPTPRKTLTDADRRRMCEYAEQHPNTKQTEIGTLFGVERSTVSKVLRQKEKYLSRDEASQSPAKRMKGKFPDIERALANWVRNQRKQGLPLDDGAIREKARFFATTVGGPDAHLKANSNTWIEKFKQKNDIMQGSKRRKDSHDGSESASNPASGAQSPRADVSPVSPASPTELNGGKSLHIDTEDSFGKLAANTHRPFHSASNPSLSSMYSTQKTSFSENVSPSSPLFTPDSANGAEHLVPSQLRDGSSSHGSFPRPRSQTFPMLGIEPFSPPSSGSLTPKYLVASALETAIDISDPVSDFDAPVSATVSVAPSMLTTPSSSALSLLSSPPLPASVFPTSTVPSNAKGAAFQSSPDLSSGAAAPQAAPSQEEARRALEVVMSFFQQQPSGFVEPQEYMSMGKLMEKLKLQSRRPSYQDPNHSFDSQRPSLSRHVTGELASIPEGSM